MKRNAASATTPQTAAQSYNGQQFDAPWHMTKAWARVVLFITAGVLAIGAGIAGAMYVSPVALGAGAIVGVPFLVFGLVMRYYTKQSAKMIYPAAPTSPIVYSAPSAPAGEVGHVVKVAGEPGPTLPDLKIWNPAPSPNLVRFPIPPNDVLFVLSEASKRGLGFRAWEGQRLPSGLKLGRADWIAVQNGLIDWQFATTRKTNTGRVVELSTSESVDDMMRRVQNGISQP